MALLYKAKENGKAQIGDRLIEFTPWTAKNERGYLSLLEDKKADVTDEDIFNILIKPNIIGDQNIVLSTNEQKLLLIKIREISLGEFLEDVHECENCGEENEIKVKLSDISIFKPSAFAPTEKDNVKVYFSNIKSNKDKKKLDLNKGAVNYIFNDFILHIESIEVDGEKHDDLPFNEKKEFFDSLPTMIFDDIFNAYLEMNDNLTLTVPFRCSSCNSEKEIEYEQIPNFLWI